MGWLPLGTLPLKKELAIQTTCQLSIDNCQLSIDNCQLSIVKYKCQVSSVKCQVKAIRGQSVKSESIGKSKKATINNPEHYQILSKSKQDLILRNLDQLFSCISWSAVMTPISCMIGRDKVQECSVLGGEVQAFPDFWRKKHSQPILSIGAIVWLHMKWYHPKLSKSWRWIFVADIHRHKGKNIKSAQHKVFLTSTYRIIEWCFVA